MLPRSDTKSFKWNICFKILLNFLHIFQIVSISQNLPKIHLDNILPKFLSKFPNFCTTRNVQKVIFTIFFVIFLCYSETQHSWNMLCKFIQRCCKKMGNVRNDGIRNSSLNIESPIIGVSDCVKAGIYRVFQKKR